MSTPYSTITQLIHRHLDLCFKYILTLLLIGIFTSYNANAQQIIDSDEGWNVFIYEDGSLWHWTGRTPARVGEDYDWVSCAINRQTALLLRSDGSLWKKDNNYSAPLQLVDNSREWSMISAAGYHFVALAKDGSIWTWGQNIHGELGYPGESTVPVKVGVRNDWKFVTSGGYLSLAIDNTNKLWGWGRNYSGDLGLAGTSDVTTPTQIGNSNWISASGGDMQSLGLQASGELWRTGRGSGSSIHVAFGDGPWIEAKAGRHQSHAIKTDGTLWAWRTGEGFNSDPLEYSQVNADTDWYQAAPGWGNSIATKTDGSLWYWGHKNCSGNECVPQKLTLPGVSENRQLLPDEFKITQATVYLNINLGMEVKRSGKFGTWVSFGLVSNGNLTLISSIQDNSGLDTDPASDKVRIMLPGSYFPNIGDFELRAYQTNYQIVSSTALNQLDQNMTLTRNITVQPAKTLGDVDGDNLLSPVDVSYVLQYVVEFKPLSVAQKQDADVNIDGFVNSMDASSMLQKILTPSGYCMAIESDCLPKEATFSGNLKWDIIRDGHRSYLQLELSEASNVVAVEISTSYRGIFSSSWIGEMDGWLTALNTAGGTLRYAAAGAVPVSGTTLLQLPVEVVRDNRFNVAGLSVLLNGQSSIVPAMPILTSVPAEDDGMAKSFAVHGNYPNPFNPTTTIWFDLPNASNVGLTVYDLTGRVMMQLPETSYHAGRHSLVLDASRLGSGIYLYKVRAGIYEGTGKMTLIK